MVLFNRFGISPLAVSGTGLDSVFRAAEDVAAQMAGQFANQVAPTVAKGYGELTRATVQRTEEGATLEVVVPGFGPDDIELSVKRDAVSVRGARGGDDENGPRHTFQRTWRLGFPIDTEAATAKVENGILTIGLPRHASENPRTIAIEGQTERALGRGTEDEAAGNDEAAN